MAGLADIPMPDGRRADDAAAVFCRKPARGGMWYNAVSGSAADPEISGFRSGRDGHIKNMAGRGFPVRGGEAMMQRLFFAGNRPRAGCGIMPFLVPPYVRKIQKKFAGCLTEKRSMSVVCRNPYRSRKTDGI